MDSSTGTNDSWTQGYRSSPSSCPLGAESEPSRVETDCSWESSATSVDHLVTIAYATPSSAPLPISSDRMLLKRRGPNFSDPSTPLSEELSSEVRVNDTHSLSIDHLQRSAKTYAGHPLSVVEASPQQNSRHRFTGSEPAFLSAATPVQVNGGDGLWICGYWLESSRPLSPHWFDPTLSENALLQHYGPLWVLDLAGENRLITPTSNGKVYVAVAPHVRVLVPPHLEGDSVEVRVLFEQQCAAASASMYRNAFC